MSNVSEREAPNRYVDMVLDASRKLDIPLRCFKTWNELDRETQEHFMVAPCDDCGQCDQCQARREQAASDNAEWQAELSVE